MIFVIRQLLYLVHDGYLWLEEPILIRTELIHRNTQLPYTRRDPTEITNTNGDAVIAVAMKKKYKLEKKKRGYIITSIQNKGIYVIT